LTKPALAIDFDGVIAETLSRKSAWISRHLGLAIDPAECSKSRCEPRIGTENYRRMSRELGYVDTLECPPFAGAVAGLRQLATEFAISVYTARPEEKAHWAREWFRHHGLGGTIGGVVSTYGRSKAALAVAAGSRALVDNDIRHLREETPAGTRRIFFAPDAGAECAPAGVITVRGWSDLVEALRQPCVAAA
jgi:hypothetical protein